MTSLAFLSQTSLPAEGVSKSILERARAMRAAVDLDRFGWGLIAHDRVFSLVPWDAGDQPGGNPLLFVDESRDEARRTTVYAGLLMTSGAAFILAGWYFGNLVTIRSHLPAFWAADSPPPRLHFRELFNEDARQKTTWRALPDRVIEDLIEVACDAVGDNEHVHPFVVAVPDNELAKAVSAAFPGGVDENALSDLVGQIVGHALRAAVADNTRRGLSIDLVIDYDATKIFVGSIRDRENILGVGGRRQATQRFLEAVRVDATARCSSKFPADASWAQLNEHGMSFRRLIEPIGLQLADMFVNVWRHLEYGAHPQLQLSRRILSRAKLTEYFWSPPQVDVEQPRV